MNYLFVFGVFAFRIVSRKLIAQRRVVGLCVIKIYNGLVHIITGTNGSLCGTYIYDASVHFNAGISATVSAVETPIDIRIIITSAIIACATCLCRCAPRVDTRCLAIRTCQMS